MTKDKKVKDEKKPAPKPDEPVSTAGIPCTPSNPCDDP